MIVWGWIIGGIAHLLAAFKAIAANIVGKVLATFGLTLISWSVILPQIKAFVMQYVSGIPAEMLNFLGYLNIGVAMSMVFSALSVHLATKVMIVPTAVADQLGQGQG